MPGIWFNSTFFFGAIIANLACYIHVRAADSFVSWKVDFLKKDGFAGVSVESMMNGLLMKVESAKWLGCWRNQLFEFPMLKK